VSCVSSQIFFFFRILQKLEVSDFLKFTAHLSPTNSRLVSGLRRLMKPNDFARGTGV